MAYGGYFPPTEEAKPAPPHHMMKHHRQKEMKHHQAVGETPRRSKRQTDGGYQVSLRAKARCTRASWCMDLNC